MTEPMRKKNWAVDMSVDVTWQITLVQSISGRMISYYYSDQESAEEVFAVLTEKVGHPGVVQFDHLQGKAAIALVQYSDVIIAPVTAAVEQIAFNSLQQASAQELAERWWDARNNANARLRAEAAEQEQARVNDPAVSVASSGGEG